MKFSDLHERLRLETWRRIDQGVLSTSLLARQSGLATTHISNFLHRHRRLSMASLDRILTAQKLSVEDLSARGGTAHAPPPSVFRESSDSVPIVSQLAAMTAPTIAARGILGFLHLPQGWLAGQPARPAVSRKAWERFAAVRVSTAQAFAMEPVLRAGSVVVLDRHYSSVLPLKPPHLNLFAIRSGQQLLFRHAAFQSGCLVLRPRSLESPLEIIELGQQGFSSHRVVGRICLCLSQL